MHAKIINERCAFSNPISLLNNNPCTILRINKIFQMFYKEMIKSLLLVHSWEMKPCQQTATTHSQLEFLLCYE